MPAAGKTLRKNKAEIAEWTGLFPNGLQTTQDSLIFVKRMVAVAVSTITYLRGIFPEDAYRARYLEDFSLKLLREDSNTPRANKVVKWMMGCFDALEKQYLQVVFIGVHTNPDEPNHIIESYQFKFRYTEKGPEMDVLRNNDGALQVTFEDTKKASVLLIRKVFLLMQNLGTLPNNVYLSMKLYYYDDITPADYQPPGFKEGECDSLWIEGKSVNFKVGEVQTAFHTFSVRVLAERGRVEKLQEGNHLGETSQVSQRTSPDREMIKDPRQKICDEEDLPSEDESAQFKKPTRPVIKRKTAGKNQARKKRRI